MVRLLPKTTNTKRGALSDARRALVPSLSMISIGAVLLGAGSAAAAMTMPTSGTSAPSVKLATTTPAGDITMPAPSMQMAPGMRMASSKPCNTMPTSAQEKSAQSLVDTSWQDSKRFQSLAVAEAAGYRPLTPTGQAVVHYINRAYYHAVLLGGPVLNTKEPQSLVYANTPKGAVLAAAMYITSPRGPSPQPGGCLTQWHVHTNLCFERGQGVVGELSAVQSSCPPGSKNRVSPPMIHVWFVPVPGGPTAVDASDAQVVQASEHVASPVNGRA